MMSSDFRDAKAPKDLNVSDAIIQDYVVTLRCAAAPTASKFRWPSTQSRFQYTFTVAMHYAHPGQYIAVEMRPQSHCGCCNTLPRPLKPGWVKGAGKDHNSWNKGHTCPPTGATGTTAN